MPYVRFFLLVAVAGLPARAMAQDTRSVLAAGQAVFDAMTARDTAQLRKLMHPNAQLFATVERDGKPVSRVSSAQDFLNQIAAADGILERMWNAEVKVSGGIATIWTQYDFHVKGKFSHCGIDNFQFVRGEQGWLLTSIIYTVVQKDCPKNPMGPPR